MAQRTINEKHIEFLINSLKVPQPEKDELIELLKSEVASDMTSLLAALEKHYAGVTKRLQEAWEDYGGHAIHLWTIPGLPNATATSLHGVAAKFLSRTPLKIGHRYDRPAPAKWNEWIASVTCVPEGVALIYHRKQKREIRTPGGYKTVTGLVEVGLVLAPDSKGVLVAEVYAGARYAKAAITFVVETFLGLTLGTTKAAREKVLKPIRFNEGHVNALCAKIAVEEGGFDGKDPQGKLGRVHVAMPKTGTQYKPLDHTHPVISTYHGAPQRVRYYNYKHSHGDGFPEANEVKFYFGLSASAHPHVTFATRSSRPATRALIDALRLIVG